MADILEEIMVLQSDADRAQKALKTIERYVVRAKKDLMPDSDGVQITVSVEWLAWMLQYFEGRADGGEF